MQASRSGTRWAATRLFVALLVPWVGACSFLLDFDELTGGPLPNQDAGPQGNGGSAGQSTGAAGAMTDSGILCPETCDDGDPCTDDQCNEGVCESVATARIVEDGFEQTVSGSNIYRAALVSGGDRFYLAVYGSLAAGQDIELYSLPATGDAWTAGPRATELADFGTDIPISPPALVFDEVANHLNAYFAVGPANPGNFYNAGRVHRAILDAALQPAGVGAVSVDQNYRYINNTLGPAAAQVPGGDTFVAWPGSTPPGTALASGIYLQSGAVALATTTAPQIWEPTDLRGLAPIYGLANQDALGQPGALWMSQRNNASQVDTHMQLLGGTPRQTFGQCVNNGVQGISVTTSRAHLDGFWFATWSKQVGTSFTTEATSILCLTPGLCAFNATCGESQSQLDTVRNPKLVTYHRLSDANNVAHQALALSVVNPETSTTQISVLVQRLSLESGDAGLTTTEVGALLLSETGLANGPDWPEIAVLAPDKLAVAWVQYGASVDTLHVARYRVCYGD